METKNSNMDVIDPKKLKVDWLLEQITAYGKKEKLKTASPKDGIAAYVWRMCRFHSGADLSLPMAAVFKLANQIEEDNPTIKFKCGIFGALEQQVLDVLDELVDKCLHNLNLSNLGGAMAYKGLLF